MGCLGCKATRGTPSNTATSADRLLQIAQRDPAGLVTSRFDYSYDKAGRRTVCIERESLGGWDGLSLDEWSNLSLTQWSQLTVGGAEAARTTFTYDPTGQLLAEHRGLAPVELSAGLPV